MHFKDYKKFLSLMMISFFAFTAVPENEGLNFFHPDKKDKIGSDEITGVTTDPTQYVGYGYNVTGGKAIYEPDALMLNNPILDVNNEELKQKIRVFDGGKTEYQSNSSTKVTQISENYSKVLGGGASIGGKIAVVNVDVDAKFNKATAENWGKISNEQYSYYSIFSGNRPVILQMPQSDLQNYLSDAFVKDAMKVRSVDTAKNLINKYGSHLLTGYTLGGIFEMTNYYATKSDTYTKETNTAFDAQVNAALGSYMNGDLNFSFTNTYGYKDNNQYATNQYKCTTYGGLAFPGLTIDQAFSWYETIAGAGYIYQLWTDSINAGKNLVIVNVPQSSKIVPLWDLLPYKAEFGPAKQFLVAAYQDLSASAYGQYRDEYTDKVLSGVSNSYESLTNTKYEDLGFGYATLNSTYEISETNPNGKRYYQTYVDAANAPTDERFKLKENSIISMSYDRTTFEGHDNKWTITENAPAEQDGLMTGAPVKITDPYNGIFEIGENPTGRPVNFTIEFTCDGVSFFKRMFTITNSNFSGGDGTETNPYLIANYDDLFTLSQYSKFWTSENHFKLIDDIDMSNKPINRIGGTFNDPEHAFAGTFDGNGHVISNIRTINTPDSTNERMLALFGTNTGIIKNLTLDYYNKELSDAQEAKGQPAVSPEFTVNAERNFVGGIVGKNDSKGVIENCDVRNLNINYTVEYGAIGKPAIGDVQVGLITSYSLGHIRNCSVNNSSVKYVATGEARLIYIGGIVGRTRPNTSESDGLNEITKCEVNNFGITADVSAAKDSQPQNGISLGGLVGLAYNSKVTSCLVRNLTPVGDEIYPISCKYAPHHIVRIGGLIGTASANNSLSRCIVDLENPKDLTKEKDSMQDSSKVVARNEENGIDPGIYSATFIGIVDLQIETEITIKDSYSNENLETEKVIDVYSKKDSTQLSKYDLTVLYGLNKNTFSSDITNALEDWYFEENRIRLNLDRVLADSLTIDTSKVRKQYFPQEDFTPEGLFVRGLNNSGDEVKINNFVIDHSTFYNDDGTINQNLGKRVIYVRCLGKTLSYEVEVVSPETDRIEVRYAEIPGNNFVGERVFDTSTIVVNRITKNGVIQKLNPDEYEATLNDSSINPGNNGLTVTYDNHEYVYNFDGIQRTAKSIEIVNAEEFANKVYNVGVRDIDLSKLRLLVHYEDINGEKVPDKEITGKDCEFIYSPIEKGDNTIIVTYNVTLKAPLILKGDVIIDDAIVNEFMETVESIEGVTDLTTLFNALNKAQQLYNEIGDGYDGTEENSVRYQAAKLAFHDAVLNYNLTAEGINKGYETAVKLGTSVSQIGVTNAGFITILAIVAWLLKRF